jgi:endonuclease/exonuclease/phosphatase family metal-dependent hydrolase
VLDLGFYAANIPAEFGGGGLDHLTVTLLERELGRASMALTVHFGRPSRKYFRNAYARDAGLRIDHLLLSPALKNRLVAGGVAREVRSWEKTSDHAPAWIELKGYRPIRFRKKARD